MGTNDIIFPGFVDLHNHPMYAMFEPWDAKQLFNNRYEWRTLEKYKQEISTPARNIQDDPQGFCDISQFAEVQALTAGTTTFSGTFLLRSFGTNFPACLSRIAVRKLEIDTGFYPRHGQERVQNVLGIGQDYNEATAAAVRRKIAEKEIDLVLIHVQSKPQDISLVVVNGVPIYGDATLMSKFNLTTEPISFCGETKNLNLGVMPNGTLSEVQKRLRQKMEVFK